LHPRPIGKIISFRIPTPQYTSHFHALRCEDVALLPIPVGHEGNVRGPPWIVLYGPNGGRYIEFVPPKIYDAAELLMPTTAPARRNSSVAVPATAPNFGAQELPTGPGTRGRQTSGNLGQKPLPGS
jgi:hypothetical protein